MKQGRTVWITGLSGAGKSTLARVIAARLRAAGEAVVLLDGDELRAALDADAAVLFDGDESRAAPDADGGDSARHGRAARLALALRYAALCRMIASQGVTVVIATISLFKEVHAWNRANLPGYVEAYLDVPLDELRRRDSKGIYRRYDSGQLRDVAGLDLAIDEPCCPDWSARHDPARPVAALADDLISFLRTRMTR